MCSDTCDAKDIAFISSMTIIVCYAVSFIGVSLLFIIYGCYIYFCKPDPRNIFEI